MKLLKNLLGTVLVLMIAVITFFTWNLIASLVSNYQSLSMTSISSLPMVILMCEIYVLLYATYDHVVLKRKDAYFYKKYSIILACFAIAGIVTSVLDGTIVYHSFVGDYILAGFPLFMLIIHAVLLGISVYLLIPSIIEIYKEKPEKTWKNPRFYGVRRVLVAFMLMFALEKLGGLVLLPIYWSSYDSGYVVLVRATINPFGSYNGNRYYWGDIDDGLNSFLFLKERYSDAIHTGAYFEGYFFGECEEAPYSLYKLIARVDGNEWTYRIDEVVPIATQNEIDSLFTGGGSISS